MASSSSECESGIRYPYPSTLNPSSFVTMKLSGNFDYPLWETQLLCLVESQELVGFIDGTILSPPESTESSNGDGTTKDVVEAAGSTVVSVAKNEEYRMWKRSDRLVKSWILGSLQEQVLATVVGLETSRSVWTKLLFTFGPNPRVKSEDKQSSGVVPEENDVSWYLPLYKAALLGDWETAEAFLDRDKDAATAVISGNQETLLHLAVATEKAIHLVRKLVERLPKEALALKKSYDETPLSVAATVGNTEAARILVEKNPSLLYISTNGGDAPLHIAASMGHWDTFSYLRSVSSDDDFAGQAGVDLLSLAISGGNFNMALDLIKRYPHVAKLEPTKKCIPPLSVIAGKSSAFRSANHLNFVESFIYSIIPVKFDNIFDGPEGGDLDIELPTTNSKPLMDKRVQSLGALERLHVMLWNVLGLFVPAVKNVGEMKLVHLQALQLVRCLCKAIRCSNDERAFLNRTYEAITKAASLDIVEVVEEIVDILPIAIWSYNDRRHYITQLAVINRSQKVFNLLYQMNGFQQYITKLRDDFGNNLLHLAGQLAPLHKLNLVPGAALQMQRELQWFKEVGKLNPSWSEMVNSSGETPAIVFSREHKQLVLEGEKWMKVTANSGTVAAALIITIVFASAITVPGADSEETGLAKYNNGAFLMFAIADAVSFFTSTIYMLISLSILTARYAEQDFLHVLPARLVLGLYALFVSILSMVVAFSTTVYLVFGNRRRWVIIMMAAVSYIPMGIIMTLLFPQLTNFFSWTFGPQIFGKKSGRIHSRH